MPIFMIPIRELPICPFILVYWICEVAGGATGVVSERSCQKLSTCPTEPTPGGSKMELPLAMAKSLSDGASDTGIMYLTRGNCTEANAAREE